MEAQTPRLISAAPLCNLVVALLILAQVPIMFGILSGPQTIWIAPWVLCAYPVILFCVIKMFQAGDMINVITNGVLSCILMGQNAVSACIYLAYSANGATVPPDVLAGMAAINGAAFLVGGIILLPIAAVIFHVSKVAGFCVGCAGVAFVALFLVYYGFGDVFGLIGAVGLTILGLFLLISTLAEIVKAPAPTPEED